MEDEQLCDADKQESWDTIQPNIHIYHSTVASHFNMLPYVCLETLRCIAFRIVSTPSYDVVL